MGTRTMGSRGYGGNQHSKSDAFSKQGPLYNLTLDEVQHQLGDLGKPLSSMNLDELLKNVWTAETNEAMNSEPLGSASSMGRQSSLELSRDLSKKTVDELWQDMQQKKKDNDHVLDKKAQPTLGEMTLEDFLAKAGIVTKSSQERKNLTSVAGAESITIPQLPQNINPQQAQWMQYQIQPIQQQHVFMPAHHGPISSNNQIMDPTYSETQMTMSPSTLIGALSDTQTPGRKRVASGDVMEKTVERRQKRMIKNRESAARSRARKQAYTHELENKVSRLEEENERLKREQEIENLLPCVPPPEPKYQLRRTTSSLF